MLLTYLMTKTQIDNTIILVRMWRPILLYTIFENILKKSVE